jgi:DNA-binding CsgD family transcriptional regulator
VIRDPLTPRELEVAQLLRLGLTQRQAAAELGISVRTVEVHAARIREKTDSPTTAAALSRARSRAASPRARRAYGFPRTGFPQVDDTG